MANEHSDSDTLTAFLNRVEKTSFFGDKNTKGSLEYNIEFYRRNGPRGRTWFQISGSLVIFLSAAIPVIAAFGDKIFTVPNALPKDVLVSVFAAAIAVFSGLNTFYRWDIAWRGQMSAWLALLNLRANWELKKAEAFADSDSVHALATLRDAAEKLISNANRIVEAETQGYLSQLKFPDTASGR